MKNKHMRRSAAVILSVLTLLLFAACSTDSGKTNSSAENGVITDQSIAGSAPVKSVQSNMSRNESAVSSTVSEIIEKENSKTSK